MRCDVYLNTVVRVMRSPSDLKQLGRGEAVETVGEPRVEGHVQLFGECQCFPGRDPQEGVGCYSFQNFFVDSILTGVLPIWREGRVFDILHPPPDNVRRWGEVLVALQEVPKAD